MPLAGNFPILRSASHPLHRQRRKFFIPPALQHCAHGGLDAKHRGGGRQLQVFAHSSAVFHPVPDGFLLRLRECGQQFINARAGEVERDRVVLALFFGAEGETNRPQGGLGEVVNRQIKKHQPRFEQDASAQ